MLSNGFYLYSRGWWTCCPRGSTFIAEVGDLVRRVLVEDDLVLAHPHHQRALEVLLPSKKWLIKIGSTYPPPPLCIDLYNETLGNLFSSITRFVGRIVCDGLLKLHFQSN